MKMSEHLFIPDYLAPILLWSKVRLWNLQELFCTLSVSYLILSQLPRLKLWQKCICKNCMHVHWTTVVDDDKGLVGKCEETFQAPLETDTLALMAFLSAVQQIQPLKHKTNTSTYIFAIAEQSTCMCFSYKQLNNVLVGNSKNDKLGDHYLAETCIFWHKLICHYVEPNLLEYFEQRKYHEILLLLAYSRRMVHG